MERTYFPFKLLITVHSAENLPIADYTTSDPYIVAYVGDRLIGKTKVIKRNHLNPKWNETLPHVNLLHTNHELEFKIFDEDVGKDDDLMGTVKLELKDVPSDGSVLRKRFPMVCAPGFKSKSFVDVTIVIARNDSVITIQSVDPHAFDQDKIDKELENDHLSQVLLQTIQREKLWELSSDVIKTTLTKWIGDDVSSALLSAPFLRDLLFEATIFNQSNSFELNSSELLIDVVRNRLKIQNSTKLLLQPVHQHQDEHHNKSSGEVYSYGPIEDLSLQINLAPDDSKFILLTFSNRFMIWNWIKWIRVAYEYWHGHLTKDDLPTWATGLTRASNAQITIHDGRSFHRRIFLDLNNPFVLRMGDDTTSISLRNMCSLMISVDSFVPSNYCLELQLSENTVNSFQQNGIDGLDVNFTFKEQANSPQRRLSVGKAVFGAISTMKQFGNRGRNLVKDTALGGFTTTVNAARIIASGDPTKVIKGAQDKIIGVTHGIATTVVSAPQSLFGKSLSHVTVRGRDDVYQLPLTPDYLEVHYLDFDLADLYKVPSIVHRSRKDSTERIISQYRLPPVKKQQALTLDLALFIGQEGALKVYGQSVQKVKRLIKLSGESSSSGIQPTSSTSERKLQHSDIAYGEPATFEVPLLKMIGYSVTVVNAKNLMVTTTSTAAGLTKDIIQRGMYAKCKLVSKDGRSGYKTVSDEFQTPSVKVTPDPVWNHVFTLVSGQQHNDREYYVRIEFCLEDITTIGGVSIGAAFIPLDYFMIKEQEYTFPVVRFRASSGYIAANAALQHGKGFGEVTIRCKKIEEDFDYHKRNFKVELQTLVKESTLFNTSWYGEILPVSGIDLDTTCVERALVNVLHDGLQLHEMEAMTILEGRNAPTNSVTSDRQTEMWAKADQVFAIHTREFMMEVFENERRTPYPPFDWSNSAYTRAHFSDLGFNKSYKFESLADAAPPDGCEWVNEWTVDTAHAKTDAEGWFYGFTFGKIIGNYAKGKTYDEPTNCHARRRKWTRKAKLRDNEYPDASQVLNSFGQSVKLQSKPGLLRSFSHSPHHKDSLDSSSSHSNHAIGGASSTNKWRKNLANNQNYGILASCLEKGSEDSPILIDWNEILSSSVVTPSILSLTFLVHRYFPDVDNFRGAEVEMFISNCPAAEFKGLLDERIWFYKTRMAIKRLVSSGNVFGVSDSSFIPQKINATHASKNVAVDESDLPDSSVAEEGIPETEDLSLGSETIKDLDDQLINLQRRIDEMNSQAFSSQHHQHHLLEKSIIERRIMRLRLYILGLFGLSLQGVHNYEENEIRQLMFTDFRRAKSINLADDVSTASNRIEYLLDMAEMRIRDAALCGWKYRGAQLENCLQILANGYFIEIVSILGKFFERENEDTAVEAQTKGLISKVELVNTYMRNNDRLHNIISNSLRPYGLEANPPAQLSLFLNFDVLVQWYNSTLITEMRSWVNKVLSTWKDVSKDVTGNASMYKNPMPWIPDRARNGMFYSNIPEDLVEALLNYLTFARIQPETVAPSFHSYLGQMDLKVCLAYANAFLLLSEGYLNALKQKEWYRLTNEEELQEYYSWVASVVNDSRRVIDKSILNLSVFKPELELPRSEDSDLSIEQAFNAYQRVESVSIDQLSCLIFIFMFYEKEDLLQGRGLAEAWKKAKAVGIPSHTDATTPLAVPATPPPAPPSSTTAAVTATVSSTLSSTVSAVSALAASMTLNSPGVSTPNAPSERGGERRAFSFTYYFESLEDYLATYKDFINQRSFEVLVDITAMKMIVLYFALLHNLYSNGDIFDVNSAWVTALIEDSKIVVERVRSLRESVAAASAAASAGKTTKKSASQVFVNNEQPLLKEMIEGSLNVLEQLPVLFQQPLSSPSLSQTVSALVEFGKKTKSADICHALAGALEVIFSLRGVSKYFSIQQQQTRSRSLKANSLNAGATNATTNLPHANSTSSNTEVGGGSVPSPAPEAKKRTSIFSYFHIPTSTTSSVATEPAGGDKRRFSLTGGSTTPHSAPQTPHTHAIDEDSNLRESVDINSEEIAEMENEREVSLVACFEVFFQELHTYNPDNDISNSNSTFSEKKRVKSLAFVHPIVRVFTQYKTKFSLLQDLILSAVSGKMRESIAQSKEISNTKGNTAAGASSPMKRRASVSVTKFMSDFLRVPQTSTDGALRNNNTSFTSLEEEDDNAPSNAETGRNNNNAGGGAASPNISSPPASRMVHVSDIPLYASIDGEPFMIITFYELKLYNLFYVDVFGQPRPYFVFRYNDFTTKTKAKELQKELENCWSDEIPIQLPIYEITSSTIEITIEIYYEGYLTHHCIGQVLLSFSPYDLPTYRAKLFEVTINQQSKKVKQAMLKTTSEGRDLPLISLSTNVSRCKNSASK